MNSEEKKAKALARIKVWREKYPERAKKSAIEARRKKPEKYRLLHARWRSKNKDRLRAYRSRQDKSIVRQQLTDWIKAHPERRREIANNWRKRNPAKVNAVYARRRAAKLKAVPKWSNPFFVSEIYDLARLRTKHLGIKYHVDHIVPLTHPLVCGLHWERNLQVIPAFENQRKNNRHWPDMR